MDASDELSLIFTFLGNSFFKIVHLPAAMMMMMTMTFLRDLQSNKFQLIVDCNFKSQRNLVQLKTISKTCHDDDSLKTGVRSQLSTRMWAIRY